MKKLLLVATLFFSINSLVHAQANITGTNPDGSPAAIDVSSRSSKTISYTPLEPLPGGFDKLQTGDLAPYIRSGFKLAILLGGLLAVVMLILGGISYMVSAVSPDAKSKAKKRIVGALWGLLILLGSYILLNTINPQLVNFKTLFLPTAGLPGGGSGVTAGGNGAGTGPGTNNCTATGPGTCQDTQCRNQQTVTPSGAGCSLDVSILGTWECYCN